jgi:hypothetical protein
MAFNLGSGGTVGKPHPPKTILAKAHAHASIARTYIGGIILLGLAIAYVVALFNKVDASALLALLGTGLGAYIGSGRDRNQDL